MEAVNQDPKSTGKKTNAAKKKMASSSLILSLKTVYTPVKKAKANNAKPNESLKFAMPIVPYILGMFCSISSSTRSPRGIRRLAASILSLV